MTQRITRLKPACVLARHPEFEVARRHALQLIRENNSLILLIADANDVVRETLSDEQRQRAIARRHARVDGCIKAVMSAFGVFVCVGILGKLSIAIGSVLGITVLVATIMLWVFLARLFNPIEFGVGVLVLVLLAWSCSEVLLKLQERAANSMVEPADGGLSWRVPTRRGASGGCWPGWARW